ncbi:MAG: hypothetical protein FJ387_18165 [Verrucomicrobia bacterium]|nr:hypothetical protein [Verrucomicrobiota bacterium]
MDWIEQFLFPQDKFLGVEWHVWKVVGWLGNLTFFSRFLVQWYATEKQRRVVVPTAFWWLSLVGAGLLFSYALFYKRDSVFIFAYAFTWIPYVRNLVIHHRTAAAAGCPQCGEPCASAANYCSACGVALHPPNPRSGA